MILDEKIFKPRPSGASVCTDPCVVKLTKNAIAESEALSASPSAWNNEIRPVTVYAVTNEAIVMEKVDVFAQYSLDHLKLHLRARYHMDSILPRNICGEEEYRAYCRSENPEFPEFQETMESLSSVVDARIKSQPPCYVHGDFTLSNTLPFAHRKQGVFDELRLRIIDVSFKKHPPVCAVDYAKVLFSVLGFDVPYSKSNVDYVIHTAVKRCSREELAYFLSSHVLRVSKHEDLTKEFVRRCWATVSTLVRQSGVKVQRKVATPVEVLTFNRWKDYPYPGCFLRRIAEGDSSVWSEGGYLPMFMFDMDGTLVDSKDATIAAYKEAGFEFKPEYWGKSATDLNIPPDQHKRKQEVWNRHWREIKVTPLGQLAQRLRESMDDFQRNFCFHIITGASEVTVKYTRRALEKKFHWNIPLRGASAYDKQEFLWYWSCYYRERMVYYFDDNLEFLKEAAKNIPSTNLVFIHYNGEQT
jgi:hypothetical protein